MIRFVLKSALLTALAAGVAAATFGTSTVAHWAKESTERVTSHFQEIQGLEPELRRIEEKVANLDDEIIELKELAFREEVEIRQLRTDIADRETTIESLRSNLERADSLLETELSTFKIRGITYTRHEVEKDVEDKMRLYQVQRDTMRQLRETLNTRENALAIAQENAQRGAVLREELTGQVRLLQAQLERYHAREVYADAVANDFDTQKFNSGIGEARQALAKFEHKLEVKNRMLDDRMRIAHGSESVAGIDYHAPAETATALREELSLLLRGDELPTEESGSVARND